MWITRLCYLLYLFYICLVLFSHIFIIHFIADLPGRNAAPAMFFQIPTASWGPQLGASFCYLSFSDSVVDLE